MTLTLLGLVTISSWATENRNRVDLLYWLYEISLTPINNIIFTNKVLINTGLLHSHALSADAIWADHSTWASCFSAILKYQAEGLSRLPGPPVASVYLAAEGGAALGIFHTFEVEGIFL